MLVDPMGALLRSPSAPADVEYTLTADDVRRATSMEALCKKFGLHVVCPNCTKLFGYGKDGVVSANDPGAKQVELRCGCTRRVYKP